MFCMLGSKNFLYKVSMNAPPTLAGWGVFYCQKFLNKFKIATPQEASHHGCFSCCSKQPWFYPTGILPCTARVARLQYQKSYK